MPRTAGAVPPVFQKPTESAVPAGTFDAQRFRLAGLNDLWVYGPDRLVVKSELPRRGIRYVLVALAREGEAIEQTEQQR